MKKHLLLTNVVFCLLLGLNACRDKQYSQRNESPARQQEHLNEFKQLKAKYDTTLATIKKMTMSELFKRMEDDAQKGVEPFNSMAYREVTGSRKDQGGTLLKLVSEQKEASYISLLALRSLDPKRYGKLDQRTKASVFLSELGRSKSYNRWGLPHLYWEPAALAVIELGNIAEPGLKKLLNDRTPAPVWGSEEVSEYKAYQYRRCDYALGLLLEIRGQKANTLSRSQKERDDLIARILAE
jgi:hypothetical protein